jgi:hypothetical protein
MSLVERLKDLKAKGLELWLEGDRLRYRAPQKVLTPQILDDLKQHKEAICALLWEGNNDLSGYPLSHNQQALWFLHQLAPESATYNVGFATGIRLPDVAALSRVFQNCSGATQQLHTPPASAATNLRTRCIASRTLGLSSRRLAVGLGGTHRVWPTPVGVLLI